MNPSATADKNSMKVPDCSHLNRNFQILNFSQSSTFRLLLGKRECNPCHCILAAHAGPCCNSEALIPYCHVPKPPTGKEDAIYELDQTGLTTHEHVQEVKSPRTECLSEFELNYAPRIINHSQKQFNHHTQRKITAFRHAFIQHVHFILINSNIELQR